MDTWLHGLEVPQLSVSDGRTSRIAWGLGGPGSVFTSFWDLVISHQLFFKRRIIICRTTEKSLWSTDVGEKWELSGKSVKTNVAGHPKGDWRRNSRARSLRICCILCSHYLCAAGESLLGHCWTWTEEQATGQGRVSTRWNLPGPLWWPAAVPDCDDFMGGLHSPPKSGTNSSSEPFGERGSEKWNSQQNQADHR